MDRQAAAGLGAAVPATATTEQVLRFAQRLVWMFLTDPRGGGMEVVSRLSRFREDSVPDDRMALMVSAGRIARTLFDAVDGQVPGVYAPPARPPWSELARGVQDMQQVSGWSDGMAMLEDPTDLGSDPRWAGYGSDGCPSSRYDAAIGVICGFAVQMLYAAADQGAGEPEVVLDKVVRILVAQS